MLVFFATILTVLLGFCGLAIDVGRVELRTNQLQAAADAGALAGAGELMHAGTNSNFVTAANNDIAAVEAANGIASTGSASPVIGATYGAYISDYSTVQVTITQSYPTVFLGLLQHANSSITLSVRAVAEVPPCMLFLNGAANGFGLAVASAGFDAPPGCPLYATTGYVNDGFAHIRGSQMRASGSAAASTNQGGATYPLVYNVPVITDPLAYVTAPPTGNCSNSQPVSMQSQATATTISMTPGTYCGKTQGTVTTPAYDIEGSHSGGAQQSSPLGGDCTTSPTVSFAPGLYVFVGGITFNCVTVTGTGVTLYFTRNSSVGYGQMQIKSTTWNLSAPVDASTNGIPGISVMNDRAWTGTTQDFVWTYSSWYADGVIYLTNTGVDGYATPMSAPNYFNMVVTNLYSYDAEVRPSTNYAGLPAGNPLHTAVSLVQ